ncbi:MAG: beta-lactamase family protein [Williamsia sp.]|nr:beta-lactamase family protein [Williamsia sp.]
MKSLLFVLWLTVLVAASHGSYAQVITETSKPNPAISPERLKRIDTLVQQYIDQHWVNGVVTLLVKDNQLIQYKGYGYLDAEARKPMPRDAIFRIASQTKALTSTGILILYEQGKLLLDEPIANYIPEFRHPVVLDKYNAADTTYTTVPAKREITFRDLLTHSGGLDYASIGTPTGNAIYAKAGLASGLGNVDADLLERMKVLAKLPLLYQPGDKWQYSLSTDLLGCLIEVISGTSLENFLRKNIFDPLGMNDTYFNLPASKANRLTAVYTEDAQHKVIRMQATSRSLDPNYPLQNKHYFSGGAGLSSTAYDYAVFMQMLLNGGIYNGHRILAPRTVQLMLGSQLPFPFNGNDFFGLGFQLTSARSAARNPRNEGSFGWGGYFGTTYWADPKEHLVCLFMTQQTPNSHGNLEAKFEELIYASLGTGK